MQGVPSPDWLNRALVVLILAGSDEADNIEEGNAVRAPVATRPIMLSNIDTNMLGRCLDAPLGDVATKTCGVAQRGFVRGRSGHDNVLSLRVAMEVFAHQPERAPGVLLLDQAQAFVSVFRTFLWAALGPHPVMRALWALYAEGTAQTLIQGVAGRPFAVGPAIRQGCPASGSVWAILYEPVVRRIRRLAARVASVVPGVFADDIGVVANEVVAAARVVGALAPRMTAGAGLRLHPTQALLL